MSKISPLSQPGFVFLLLASTMTVLAGAALSPALPGMRAAFSDIAHAELWVKVILTTPGLVIALCAPFVGLLLDKQSKHRLLMVALAAYGVFGSLGYLLHDSVLALILGRVGLGVAVAFIMIATTTLAGEYFKGPQFGHFMGLQAAFSSFGGVVFLGVSGMLAELHWTAAFLIYLLAWVVLPGIMLYLKPPDSSKPVAADNAAIPAEGRQPSRAIALCYALGFIEVFMLYMIPLHFPFYIQSFGAVSPAETGWLIAGMLCILAITSLNYQRWSRMGHYISLHALGLGGTGAGMLILGLAPSYGVALAGLALMGIGLGILRPNLVVWLFSLIALTERGKVMGGLTTCFFIASFAVPFVTQPLIEQFGMTTCFILLGSGCLVMGILLKLGYWRLTDHQDMSRASNG